MSAKQGNLAWKVLCIILALVCFVLSGHKSFMNIQNPVKDYGWLIASQGWFFIDISGLMKKYSNTNRFFALILIGPVLYIISVYVFWDTQYTPNELHNRMLKVGIQLGIGSFCWIVLKQFEQKD